MPDRSTCNTCLQNPKNYPHEIIRHRNSHKLSGNNFKNINCSKVFSSSINNLKCSVSSSKAGKKQENFHSKVTFNKCCNKRVSK